MKGKGGAVWIARQCKQVLVPTIATPDTGKAIVQDTAVQITVNHLPHIRPEKPILFREPLVIHLFKRLELIFHALVILRNLGIARVINGRNIGHWLFSSVTGYGNTQQYTVSKALKSPEGSFFTRTLYINPCDNVTSTKFSKSDVKRLT